MNHRNIFFILFIISPLIYSNKLSKYTFVDFLIYLANQKSDYSQEYGKNTLLWDGEKWWCDCSNLLKALFNGRDIFDTTVGLYQKDLSLTGDINADQLINKCEDLSNDFTSLKE